MNTQKDSYLCIDMKSFYASVECAERGLNPFETCLVVADPDRGKNALCLAISPKLKALGVRNRCRLSEIPGNISYITALPRMQLYIEYAADIYALYLEYFDPQDIHVYSIDECFLDVTPYLAMYNTDAPGLARRLMDGIAERLHIPATAGVGTNLFLAKIALDITAKHTKEHIGILDEETFRATLWDHRPITDFWQIAEGTARTLSRHGIFSLRDIAEAPEKMLYKLFGINAELLIDHAWGRESCRMEDIKNYRSRSKSVSFSQILPRDYSREEARLVMQEMILNGSRELMKRKLIAGKVQIGIGYSGELAPSTGGGVRLMTATAVNSLLQGPAIELFDREALPGIPIRRLGLCFENLSDETCEGFDFFTDWHSVEKERAREKAVLELSERYGKNAVLRGMNLLPAGTQRERNGMIGGHRAGYDDKVGTGETVRTL